MKKCPYCGKEYPDDVVVCEIDRSPLVIAKSNPPPDSSNPSQKHPRVKQPVTFSRVLSIVGFSILSGLFGLGATWLIIGFYAKYTLKGVDAQLDFAAKGYPLMICGAAVGFILGLIGSLKVAAMDAKKETEIEEKYVGEGGRFRIYSGAPLFVMAVLGKLFFEKLLNRAGTETGVWIAFAIFLAIITMSLVLYDRISAKFIVPIGIIGWLLTLAIALESAIHAWR